MLELYFFVCGKNNSNCRCGAIPRQVRMVILALDDEKWMGRALLLAQKAADLGEVPVGAVVVKDKEVVGEGYNLRESGKNALYHAEVMAIDEACRTLGGWRLWECTLYVTLEPCPMCTGAIINSRMRRLVYGATDPKAGCCGGITNLFALPFNHLPVVEGGMREDESRELLQRFFEALRQKRQQ